MDHAHRFNRTSLDAYEFIVDRCRAIMQEIRVQRLQSSEIVDIMEQMIRYLIISGYRHYTDPKFDIELHNKQLQSFLLSLQQCRPQNSSLDLQETSSRCEFLYYTLILHFEQASFLIPQYMSHRELLNEQTKQVLRLIASLTTGNAIRFNNEFERCDYIIQCLVTVKIVLVLRQQIINSFNVASKRQLYPLSALKTKMILDSITEVQEYCKQSSISTQSSPRDQSLCAAFTGKPLRPVSQLFSVSVTPTAIDSVAVKVRAT